MSIITGAAHDVATPAEAPKAPEAVKPTGPTPEEVLAKREKQFRAQAQQFQTEKQKWAEERKKFESDYVPKASLKDNWLDMLTGQGMTQEQIAQHLLNTPQDPHTKQIMAKLKSLEESQVNMSKAAEQKEIEQFEQIKKQMNVDIAQLVDTDTSYEMMKSVPGAVEAALELIIEDFEKTGVLKDIEAACKEYEEFLLEDTYKLTQLQKMQAKLKPKQEETAPEAPTNTVRRDAQKQTVTVTPHMKTLSNTMQTQTSSKSSEKQRIERALAAFAGKPIT